MDPKLFPGAVEMLLLPPLDLSHLFRRKETRSAFDHALPAFADAHPMKQPDAA